MLLCFVGAPGSDLKQLSPWRALMYRLRWTVDTGLPGVPRPLGVLPRAEPQGKALLQWCFLSAASFAQRQEVLRLPKGLLKGPCAQGPEGGGGRCGECGKTTLRLLRTLHVFRAPPSLYSGGNCGRMPGKARTWFRLWSCRPWDILRTPH